MLNRIARVVAAMSAAFAVLTVVSAMLVVGSTTMASARSSAEAITAYDIDITVNPDGSALFRESISYDFGPNALHGIERILATTMRYDEANDRSYPLTVVKVSAVGASAQYSITDIGGGRERIRIGDPNRTITGAHVYTITYRLEGVVNAQPGDDELYWNVIGSEWRVPIERATVAVHLPGNPTRVACFAGRAGTTPCDLARIGTVPAAGATTAATFAQQSLDPGENLTVVVAIPDVDGGAVEPQPILVAQNLSEPRTIGDMFALTPLSLGLTGALAALAAAVVAPLQFLVGRDRRAGGDTIDSAFSDQTAHGERVPLRAATAIPVEFVPPDNLRPGQLGVLHDEVADMTDVSATLIDLAVRGFLRIEEITDGRRIKDYTFVQLRGPAEQAELLAYERYLLEQLFATGSPVQLLDLKNKFATATSRMRTLLYENAAENGWFAARPDHVRTIWALGGFAVLAAGAVATFFLARESRYGLVGLPLGVAGFAVMIGARWMPRRTPKGTGLERRTRGFVDFIENSEKYRAAFAERKNIFTEYLPYAVAFGATKKWANALSVLGLPAPDTSLWYVGVGPLVWTTFGDRMDTFTSTATATLTSTPGGSGASGFSGGGVGGGGGGGGGGSW